MNDINELYRPLAFYYHPRHDNRNNDDIHKKMKEDYYKYQQISLTMDGNRMGFDIPAMWGHYAQNGNGVCLVLTKSGASLVRLSGDNIEFKLICSIAPVTVELILI